MSNTFSKAQKIKVVTLETEPSRENFPRRYNFNAAFSLRLAKVNTKQKTPSNKIIAQGQIKSAGWQPAACFQ